MYSPLEDLKLKFKNTGFVNAHSHLDRAFTITKNDFLNSNIENHLFEKWKIVDNIKRNSTELDYYKRICLALDSQAEFNVKTICSFIDVDPIVEYKALDAALEAKEYADLKHNIKLVLACQTLKPLKIKKNRKLIENTLEDLDIIGGLPSVDEDQSYHLDVIMSWAKSTNKRLHVHVDQLNTQLEKETELLAKKAIQHGMEGKVTAIHSISLACHPLEYRNYVYDLCLDAGLSFISCPTAWIDSRRNESLSVTHNATTPVDEILSRNIPVAIGSDNIYDVYKPFSNGCMFTELRLLLEANHYYNINKLFEVGYSNGLLILGENK